MNRFYTDEVSIMPEITTAAAVFITGGVLLTYIDQGVIGKEYNALTDKIIPIQNQVDALTGAKPILTTAQAKADATEVLSVKNTELQTLTQERSHHHAPLGINAEMAGDGVLIVLAVLACSGIRRFLHNRRKKQLLKPAREDTRQPALG